MGLCSMCWGEGVVDKGTKRERECPNCCGIGFEPEDGRNKDDDDDDD